MKMISQNAKIFAAQSVAQWYVTELSKGDLEGWSFKIVPMVAGPGYVIAMFDEEGIFVSYWTEEQS